MNTNNKSVSSSSSSGGIGFAGLLTIVFITLKLLGKITWSWWWVVSPLWISALLGIAILLVIFGGAGAVLIGAHLVDGYNDRKRMKAARARAERLRAAQAIPVNAARKTEKESI